MKRSRPLGNCEINGVGNFTILLDYKVEPLKVSQALTK